MSGFQNPTRRLHSHGPTSASKAACYDFSNYRDPSVKLDWLATFSLTCMGDVFDAIANQGFRPDEPYPHGVYSRRLDYFVLFGSSGLFALETTRVDAPGWNMTFCDVMDDLEALCYAALWYENRAGGIQEMDLKMMIFE